MKILILIGALALAACASTPNPKPEKNCDAPTWDVSAWQAEDCKKDGGR